MGVAGFTAPNGDSQYDDFSGLYGKGLKQSAAGIVDSTVTPSFINSINNGITAATNNARPIRGPGVTPLFEDNALKLGGMGNPAGRLNGPQAAFSAPLVAMAYSKYNECAPPPPPIGSPYYAVELAELYWASLLRDVPFTEFTDKAPSGHISEHRKLIEMACADLSSWAKPGKNYYLGPVNKKGDVTPSLLFRGGRPANLPSDFTNPSMLDASAYFADETFGPYLSQLCLSMTGLGAQSINQQINTLASGRDYMIDLTSWLNSQNGKTPASELTMDPTPRHIRCGRDLAAYTHVDELYQAYLIAYLVLSNSWGAPKNPGSPYTQGMPTSYMNQKPFGTLGDPEAAAVLGLVAREAINAVWWQKWAVHLRARPEAAGGLVHLWKTGAASPPEAVAAFDATFGEIMKASLKASSSRYSPHSATSDKERIFLLSQAFPEGSPTHPAYPTGHGTVAGACITVLKFFYDGTKSIQSLTSPVVPAHDGLGLRPYEGDDIPDMTLNGELHKLAHNISFGHGIHAGIHWRTDTDASMLLGEQVAIDCLKQLVKTYTEVVNAPITKMNGETVMIAN